MTIRSTALSNELSSNPLSIGQDWVTWLQHLKLEWQSAERERERDRVREREMASNLVATANLVQFFLLKVAACLDNRVG